MPHAPHSPLAPCGAVLIARPDWGRARIAGADRAAFMHNMTAQDIKGLAPGHGAPAVMVNQKGQILDMVEVHAGEDAFYVVAGPGRLADDLAWWDRYLITEDVTLENLSAETALYYMTGPGARALMDKLVPAVAQMPPFGMVEGAIAGHAVRVLGTHGYDGEGYHLWMEATSAIAVHEALVAAGATEVAPDRMHQLRVLAGVPMAGAELTEKRNPWEARLDQALSLHKGCYLGQEIVARLNTYNKVQRFLVGLALQGATLPEPGAAVSVDDQPVGEVTSVAVGETGPVALAFVKAAHALPGTSVMIQIPGGQASAEVLDMPFWAGKTRPVGAPSRT